MRGRCAIRWFKHDTDCDRSEGLSFLVDQEGFAGYGRWFRLLEIVAEKMDHSDRCYAEYSPQKWCSLLGLKQKKLKTFLELTENKLKTKVVFSENIIRIEIPNLLKKRDDYSRKSVQRPDKVTPRSKIQDIRHKKEPKTLPLPSVFEEDEKIENKHDIYNFLLGWFWSNYPHRDGLKIGKKATDAAIRKYIKPDEFDYLQKAVKNFRESPGVQKGIGVPDPERFIYSAKKKDEPWREWVNLDKSNSASARHPDRGMLDELEEFDRNEAEIK